jgi:hypothetical protein
MCACLHAVKLNRTKERDEMHFSSIHSPSIFIISFVLGSTLVPHFHRNHSPQLPSALWFDCLTWGPVAETGCVLISWWKCLTWGFQEPNPVFPLRAMYWLIQCSWQLYRSQIPQIARTSCASHCFLSTEVNIYADWVPQSKAPRPQHMAEIKCLCVVPMV